MALAEQKKTTKQKEDRTGKKGTIQTEKRNISSKAKATIIPNRTKPSSRVNRPSGFREGRGFSLPELQRAGVSVADARRLRVSVDLRRGTQYDVNIKAIKDWNLPPKTTKLPKKSVEKSSRKPTDV